MRDYLALPDDQAEAAIYQRSRVLDETSKSSFSEMGLMCVQVKKRDLWNYRIDPETGFPCRSFTRWMHVAFPFSYSSAFAAYALAEKLLADIPAEDISEISPGNLHTLGNLSTAVRSDPQTLMAAKSKKPAEFVRHVQAQHPEQHLSITQWIKIPATTEQAHEIYEAAELAIINGDAISLTDWIFQQAIDYRQSVTERSWEECATRTVQ